MHGKLELPPPAPVRLNGFHYSSDWVSWLLAAPSEIRVVLDQIDDDTLSETRQAVIRSEVLCFLGFAYATENLARWISPAPSRAVLTELFSRPVFGTAFAHSPR